MRAAMRILVGPTIVCLAFSGACKSKDSTPQSGATTAPAPAPKPAAAATPPVAPAATKRTLVPGFKGTSRFKAELTVELPDGYTMDVRERANGEPGETVI